MISNMVKTEIPPMSNDPYEITTIGGRLRALREERGLTVRKAGEISGVPWPTILNWEQGKHVIDPDRDQHRMRIAALAEAYAVPANHIWYGTRIAAKTVPRTLMTMGSLPSRVLESTGVIATEMTGAIANIVDFACANTGQLLQPIATGDAMLFFRRADQPSPDRLQLVEHDGIYAVYRVEIDGKGGVWVSNYRTPNEREPLNGKVVADMVGAHSEAPTEIWITDPRGIPAAY